MNNTSIKGLHVSLFPGTRFQPLFLTVDFFTAVKQGNKSVVISFVQRYPKEWKTARDEVQGIVESRGYTKQFH